jgi:hypothetical protein
MIVFNGVAAALPTTGFQSKSVRHDLIFFRDQPATQMIAVEVIHLVLSAAAENLDSAQKAKRRELGIPANRESSELPIELPLLGEGGSDGQVSMP